MSSFKLVSDFTPKGDQSNAIEALSIEILAGKKYHVLLGVTGSGKTFTMAHVIAKVAKHNGAPERVVNVKKPFHLYCPVAQTGEQIKMFKDG